MQEVARKAIRQYAAGWEQTRTDFLRTFVTENASLLDRLGR